MRIAVIPARGGSKRIPRKNIKPFYGKPMIAWSILAAFKSALFDHVIVSTDDTEIAAVADRWRAEVPFMRPQALADDHTGITEVIAHATQWCLVQGWRVEQVCCICATAPFIRDDDLQRGYELLTSGNWEYALSVTDFAAPIFRAFHETSTGGLKMFFPEYFASRSQDLPRALQDAGQFYWGKPSAWLGHKRIFEHYAVPVSIPRWRVQDIDTEDDWKRAEILAPVIFEQPTE